MAPNRPRRPCSWSPSLCAPILLCLLLTSSWRPARAAPGPDRALLRQFQDAMVAVADELEPAVVTVVARRAVPAATSLAAPRSPQASGSPRTLVAENAGSGVIVSPDGWIITNDHVVSRASRVTIRMHDGREMEGTVLRDYASDIALVKVSGAGLPCARLGDSDALKVGQWAIAIGSPFRYEGSFSLGVISALHRRQLIPDRSGEGSGRLYPDMIQTDAAINPGNSGGPLVNLDGEVVGIATAMESDDGKSLGIGFAVPANTVRYVTDELRAHGKVRYGYLGVALASVTPLLAESYRVDGGAMVTAEPQPGTPAAAAGIHADDVIVAIDDRPVRGEADLRERLARTAPGTAVTITVRRGDDQQHLKATIGEAPDPVRNRGAAPPVRPGIGLEVASLARDDAEKAGLGGKPAGVVVRSWDRTCAAAETELQNGDVLLRVNGQPVESVEAYRKLEASLKPGSVARLVWQGRRGLEAVRRVAVVMVQ